MTFNNLVKETVEPLLYFGDFLPKTEIEGILEYDHKLLTISFTYDHNVSFEVNATFTFKVSGRFYEYAEMKEYFSDQAATLIATQLTNEGALKVWLAELHTFLNRNLNSLINNHVEIAKELEKIRIRHIENDEQERNNRFLREEVEKYWTNQDYAGLVDLLKNYNNLEGSVRKKYEYAIKMTHKKG